MRYQNKAILGGLIGNLVEAYDISICYFLATELTHELLGQSKSNPTIILTLTFISYLAKPIGAFFLGLLSDLMGRKTILMASILIMGLCTFLIGLIPGYQMIGISAAGLFLALRIVQSMALGSEFLNSASLLVESGDEKQRGFRGCWSSVGVKAGYLIACLVVVCIHYLNPNSHQLWRIPFFLAIITTAAGYFIRAKMPESLEYIRYYATHEKPSTKDIYKQSLGYIKAYPFLFYFAFFSSLLSVTTGFFFYLYAPLHAIQYSHLARPAIMGSNIFALTLVTVLIPLFGWISDRTNRLNILYWASIVLLVLAYPFMYAISHGNLAFFVIMQAMISVVCAAYYSVATVLITEFFPMHIRCTALSLVFSFSASLASGVPPLLADYLARVTKNPSAPCIIIIFLALMVFINCILLKRQQAQQNSFLPLEVEGI